MTVDKIDRDVRREIDDILADRRSKPRSNAARPWWSNTASARSPDEARDEKLWRRFEQKINNRWEKNKPEAEQTVFPICNGCKNMIKTSSVYIGKDDGQTYCNNCASKYTWQKYFTKVRQRRRKTRSRLRRKYRYRSRRKSRQNRSRRRQNTR